jgi:hypothetical protein
MSNAGWSSPVARQAHNLEVTGSNPVPAPKIKTTEDGLRMTHAVPLSVLCFLLAA